MNDIFRKLEVLKSIGDDLLSGAIDWSLPIHNSIIHNPWFTEENIKTSIKAIAENYLNENALKDWISNYNIIDISPKRVGLILAGNIPLVGFHDVLCVILSGHKAMIKLSEKDRFLLPAFVDLYKVRYGEDPGVEFVDRLKDFDAIIATGSNNSARYFEEYFSKVPHIIRKNRNGVAIIDHTTTESDLINLGKDLFTFFGLGCRNVSKLYVAHGFELKYLFEAIESYKEVINHNKYKNNFDYYYSIALLNREKFLTNDFLLLKESEALSSPISVLNYEWFDSISEVEKDLKLKKDQIQLVLSSSPIDGFKHFDFGTSQSPSLSDYADGVDTLAFLLNI